MLKDKTIIVIQNTTYHFETALSVYRSLEDAGADVHLHRCCADVFEQRAFAESLKMKMANEDAFQRASCGFVISAYPNPHVSRMQSVPNGEDHSIKRFGDRIVYISHRFKCRQDYESEESPVRPHNSLCLSPLCSSIGLDHLFPIDMPVKPIRAQLRNPIQFTAQGHFNLKNRKLSEWVWRVGPELQFNFVGSGSWKFSRSLHKVGDNKFFSDLAEPVFYYLLNFRTHFLIPLIDDKIKEGTYARERYSSNFNQAYALEKPVFCHEFFKDVYELPGVYYNDENVSEMADSVVRMSPKDYEAMLDQFAVVKARKRFQNNEVLRAKVLAVGG